MSIRQNSYKSDIVMGERYRDDQTGIEGTVTTVAFYQHGCERATLEAVIENKIVEYGFDAPRLTRIATGKVATTTRTGGPRDNPPARPEMKR